MACAPDKIGTAAGFSAQNLSYRQANLNAPTETFLQSHDPVFFCYVSFRPEYRLHVLREGMKLFRQRYPRSGFIWLWVSGERDAKGLGLHGRLHSGGKGLAIYC